MKEQVVGIVGGMGSFATLDFFRRILLAFPAEKEWERPRVIIDNNCTMPSRVRAILYNEKYEEVVTELSKSISMLIDGGATDIILACNTSHYFLKDVIEKNPVIKDKIINIIEMACREMQLHKVKKPYLIASEGTIDTNIYQLGMQTIGENDIVLPTKSELVLIREFIEAVKQNKIDKEIKDKFRSFFNSISSNCVILGCTEIPIIYHSTKMDGGLLNKKIIDPLESSIEELKNRRRRYEND